MFREELPSWIKIRENMTDLDLATFVIKMMDSNLEAIERQGILRAIIQY